MAITKERKNELVSQYEEWAENSEAIILTEYLGLSMSDLDKVRQQSREAGGEFHIVKNTLTKIALESSGFPLNEEFFVGTTAIGFAFEDAPAMAKVIKDLTKSSDSVKIKGGYLGKDFMDSAQVNALADLPPLPVMRALLLGVLHAPASQLARIIQEPGRKLAQVIKAKAEQESSPA
jgi:large subunit ribosomal protein L10